MISSFFSFVSCGVGGLAADEPELVESIHVVADVVAEVVGHDGFDRVVAVEVVPEVVAPGARGRWIPDRAPRRGRSSRARA
jgi:hypothetical protein